MLRLVQARGRALTWLGIHGNVSLMSAVISAPKNWVDSVSHLRLPPRSAKRMQDLMDRNTEGALGPLEQEELEALVEWSEEVSLIKAEAMNLLARELE